MKITAKFKFGLFSLEDDPFTFNSLAELKEYFKSTWSGLYQLGCEASPEDGIPGAWCWYGEEAGDYPDFALGLGPRGGVRVIPT